MWNLRLKVLKKDLPHRAVAVWRYLCDRANNDTLTCFPSVGTMARELGYSQSTVRRALKDLENSGLIKRTPRFYPRGSSQQSHGGGQSSNLYELII